MALIGEMQYLTIGGNTYSIPTSGGSTVSVTRTLTSGTKTATISVDGTSYDLYAPTPNAGTITSVKTTAGAHTTIDVSSGSASFNVPTKTSHLTNDSGFVTTDEKLKTTVAFNGTYFPLFGAATSTAETKYYSGNFRYSKTTSIDSLQLGQASSSSTSKGRLTLCSGPYYTYLDPPLYSTISANQTYTLPDKSGTIALTSDEIGASHIMVDSGYYTDSSVDIALDDLAGLFSYTHVIEFGGDGSSNTWNYRKWSDGTLECWARFYIDSMNINSTTGQLKYADVSLTTTQRTYPVAFTNWPTVTVSGNVTDANGWVVMNNTNYSKTQIGTMVAYSSASRTGVGVTVNVYAIGKWK